VQSDLTADSWTLRSPEPTTLIALWPGDRAPTMTEVLEALGSRLDGDLRTVDDATPGAEDVLWNVVVELPGRNRPVIFWSEPARKLDAGELDDPAALDCRWIVGAETPLDEAEPLRDFTALMKLLTAAFDKPPAILDTNSGRWHPRPALDEHFGGDTAPPEDVLWMTHIVVSGPDDDTAGAWLHTHGLRRCGRPELEMIEVPTRYADAAAELLAGLAGRLLEEPTPPPGKPFAVGPGLEVALQPWQAVAPRLGDAPGGIADRTGMPGDAHVGVRAAVCGAEPGDDHPPTSWPRDVLQRIHRGEGTLFLSRHETRRLAERARAAWPRFLGAFATVSPQLLRAGPLSSADADDTSVQFLVKAGFAGEISGGEDEGDAQREHLWFAVRRCEEERFQGELLNQPVLVTSLQRGDLTWIQRARVSDWSVVTPLGSFGPADLAAMFGALQALAKEPGAGA
jgi:hypothetical protein